MEEDIALLRPFRDKRHNMPIGRDISALLNVKYQFREALFQGDIMKEDIALLRSWEEKGHNRPIT